MSQDDASSAFSPPPFESVEKDDSLISVVSDHLQQPLIPHIRPIPPIPSMIPDQPLPASMLLSVTDQQDLFLSHPLPESFSPSELPPLPARPAPLPPSLMTAAPSVPEKPAVWMFAPVSPRNDPGPQSASPQAQSGGLRAPPPIPSSVSLIPESAIVAHHDDSSNSNRPLSSMERDVKPLTARQLKEQEEYTKLREKALLMDFPEIEKLSILFQSGHDSLGRPIVVAIAQNLPAKTMDMEVLLLYAIKTLDPIANNDYVLVFVGTNLGSENRPSIAWLRRTYGLLSRKFKKNLKTLYLVHPTWWIRFTLNLCRPFISAKFWKKVVIIDDIADIYKSIDRSQITFPDAIILYNREHNKRKPVFGTRLEEVLNIEHSKSGIPMVVAKSINYLSRHYEVEGLFRKSGEARLIEELKKSIDRGDNVDFSTVSDPHAIAGLMKLFLREMPDPVFPHDYYEGFVCTQRALKDSSPDCEEVWTLTMRRLLSSLPIPNVRLMKLLFNMMKEVAKNSEKNLMSPANLAIVFTPNILRFRDDVDLMSVMRDTPVVNSIVKRMIERYDDLFADDLPHIQALGPIDLCEC